MQPITCSVDDASIALGVCRSSVYNLLRSGKLVSVKVGRRNLVKIASIHEMLGNDRAKS